MINKFLNVLLIIEFMKEISKKYWQKSFLGGQTLDNKHILKTNYVIYCLYQKYLKNNEFKNDRKSE